jgi:putative transposase
MLCVVLSYPYCIAQVGAMTTSQRKGSHSVFSVKLHFVFVTRYRHKVITAEMLTRMEKMFSQVCKTMDCELLEFNGEADHVHLFVDFHPKNSISAVAGSLKACSSRAMRKEFSEHLSTFYWKPVFWSGSYYVASSGGAPIATLKAYIKNQEAPT